MQAEPCLCWGSKSSIQCRVQGVDGGNGGPIIYVCIIRCTILRCCCNISAIFANMCMSDWAILAIKECPSSRGSHSLMACCHGRSMEAVSSKGSTRPSLQLWCESWGSQTSLRRIWMQSHGRFVFLKHDIFLIRSNYFVHSLLPLSQMVFDRPNFNPWHYLSALKYALRV